MHLKMHLFYYSLWLSFNLKYGKIYILEKEYNMERLQKYMASCGVASRRNSEKIIASGRVKVNGIVVTEMGTKVGKNDVVMVDDKVINKVTIMKYYVMNKPRNVVSTVSDPQGRKTIISILPDELKEMRLFPIGRLDYDTKGVLLLTNDGELMNNLVGPKSHIEKEYLVRVKGIPSREDLIKLSKGVRIDDYVTRPCKVNLKDIDNRNQTALLSLVIEEGKYHQVKRMVEAIGYPALKLTRIRFGRIEADGLKEGEVRELTIHELKILMADSKLNK